jgi:hypothetical protein
VRRLLFPFAACGVLALLCGCASQVCRVHEYYEPTEATMFTREDGLKVGALKSEAIKDGQPDWSPKSISLISVGK